MRRCNPTTSTTRRGCNPSTSTDAVLCLSEPARCLSCVSLQGTPLLQGSRQRAELSWLHCLLASTNKIICEHPCSSDSSADAIAKLSRGDLRCCKPLVLSSVPSSRESPSGMRPQSVASPTVQSREPQQRASGRTSEGSSFCGRTAIIQIPSPTDATRFRLLKKVRFAREGDGRPGLPEQVALPRAHATLTRSGARLKEAEKQLKCNCSGLGKTASLQLDLHCSWL